MFTLKINTDGSAFCDPYTGEPDRHYAMEEVKRILKDLVTEMEFYSYGGVVLDFKNLRDFNGNTVGKATLK